MLWRIPKLQANHYSTGYPLHYTLLQGVPPILGRTSDSTGFPTEYPTLQSNTYSTSATLVGVLCGVLCRVGVTPQGRGTPLCQGYSLEQGRSLWGYSVELGCPERYSVEQGYYLEQEHLPRAGVLTRIWGSHQTRGGLRLTWSQITKTGFIMAWLDKGNT